MEKQERVAVHPNLPEGRENISVSTNFGQRERSTRIARHHSERLSVTVQNAVFSLDAQLELRDLALESLAHAQCDLLDHRRVIDDVVLTHVDRQHRTAVEA